MPSGKFLFTLIGISLAVFAICTIDFGKPSVENFWVPMGGARAIPGARRANGETVAMGGTYVAPDMMGSGKFVSVPNFQAILSPRFSNVSYGANIRYNMPDRQNMASPCEPLTFGDMATENYKPPSGQPGKRQQQAQPRQSQNSCGMPILPPVQARAAMTQAGQQVAREQAENYCGNCGTGQCGGGCPPSCGKGGYGLGHAVAGGYELPSGYTNGNWQDVYDSIPASQQSMGSDLPIGTMSTMDGAGNVDQYVHINHIFPQNTKSSSNLYAQGDFFRGDVAVTPCQMGWFSVCPNIARDVNPGAMGVLAGAGAGGESYNKLMNLIVTASGGTQTALGGVDLSEGLQNYNINMSNQAVTNLQANMGDVQVTSFP